MADPLVPTTDGDITPPPVGTDFQPAAPLKDTGVEFSSETGGSTGGARQSLRDGAQKLTSQAGDKARSFVEDNKAKAGGALTQLSEMLTDAAGTVDEKLGAQYGGYARSAAQSVAGLADSLNAKSADDLVEDVRELVRKSPAVAIGTAAALGFVIARIVGAGFDQRGSGQSETN